MKNETCFGLHYRAEWFCFVNFNAWRAGAYHGFFAQLAVEGLLESFGVLAQGWGESHLLMLIGIAALTALPVFIMMFVATWKKILAVELLPQD